MKLPISIITASLLITGCSLSKPSKEDILKKEQLKVEVGKVLFFDKILSKNQTQSCATCHNPEHGYIDNRVNETDGMASLGDDGKSIGDRNAPTISYAMFSPHFHFHKKKKKYIGGQFWDGREAHLKGQAGGPPMNPIEMGMPNQSQLVDRIKENPYYFENFKSIYGEDIFQNPKKAYKAMAEAIASYEMTKEFSPFDSKYDRYLKGEYELSDLEELGKSLFFSNNNTNCSSCHMLKGEDREGETFTNYEYHNIGTPENKRLRAKNGIKIGTIDNGLLANPHIKDKKHKAKMKVPTLRNIAVTAPYMHNGVFKDLKTVIEFYDSYNNKDRDINPETGKPWDKAIYKDSISFKELKMKKLTDRKVDALVAFLKTLTDKKYEYLLKD